MKFAALALLGLVGAQDATTVTVDNNEVDAVVNDWAQAAAEMEQWAKEEGTKEAQELQPYIQKLQGDMQVIVDTDMRYGEMWLQEA